MLFPSSYVSVILFVEIYNIYFDISSIYFHILSILSFVSSMSGRDVLKKCVSANPVTLNWKNMKLLLLKPFELTGL